MILRLVGLALLVGATSSLCAQEALTDSLPPAADATSPSSRPATAWLDLRQHPAAGSKPQSAPNWVEGVGLTPVQSTGDGDGIPKGKSTFRIHLAQPSTDYNVLFFRLFFDDKPDARPEVIAWDE